MVTIGSLNSLENFEKKQEQKFKEFDENLNQARLVSRDLIYKIIIICSSIIGFSLTLMSLPDLELKSDVHLLQISWYLFLSTISLGFLSIFIEARLHYALKWRAIQVQDYDEKYTYPLGDKFKVFFIGIFSLVFPRNLIFCRIYKTKKEKTYYALLNAKVIVLLAELEKITFNIENLFVFLFISALFVFIKSFN